jgi:predicted S18 family serine protease
MKDIKNMNLAEAITALRDVDVITRGYQCNYDAIEELADRIQELFEHENEGVVAISEAYQRLREHHRWIPFKERYPVGADGDKILVYNKYNGVFTIGQSQIRDYNPIYWSKITTPEGV